MGLDEAWLAWADDYNVRVHRETEETPRDRWRRRIAETGIFPYQVGASLEKRHIEVRDDPDDTRDRHVRSRDERARIGVWPFLYARHVR